MGSLNLYCLHVLYKMILFVLVFQFRACLQAFKVSVISDLLGLMMFSVSKLHNLLHRECKLLLLLMIFPCQVWRGWREESKWEDKCLQMSSNLFIYLLIGSVCNQLERPSLGIADIPEASSNFLMTSQFKCCSLMHLTLKCTQRCWWSSL